jgi:hypothetical protein
MIPMIRIGDFSFFQSNKIYCLAAPESSGSHMTNSRDTQSVCASLLIHENPKLKIQVNTCETTKNLSALPCWRKIGRKMAQTIAILGVGIVLSLESGTAQVITSPPTALAKKYSTTYNYKKYLWMPQYNIHIIGTATVSDWFMRESYWMINNVMGAMLPVHRAKFSGHQALLVTNVDPDLSFLGGAVGQRNTGSIGWSCFNEALVGTTAQDTYNLGAAAEFRGWETPIHEFGHSIELTLGLGDTTVATYQANNAPFNPLYPGELFAWSLEKWFAVRPANYRSQLPTWQRNYLATVFNVNNTWSPAYAQRPTAVPVGPLGFYYCAGEGQPVNLWGVNDVAYGANTIYSNFAYLTNRTGVLYFNPPTFGYDPYQNVLKAGFYRLKSNIVAPPGYTLCADEGGTYTLPGVSSVAYGSNGNFKFFRGQPKGSRITFNSTVFGGDPNYGVLKNGFYKLGSSL